MHGFEFANRNFHLVSFFVCNDGNFVQVAIHDHHTVSWAAYRDSVMLPAAIKQNQSTL